VAAIGSRAFAIIEKLAESAGEVVTKDALIAHAWPGIAVGEETLRVHVAAIRKALGSDRGILKTVSGRGYRLLGGWHARDTDDAMRVDDHDGLRDSSGLLSNLPAPITPLVGRAYAAKLLRDLLTAYRIVTLTGPGGIGKTRLATEVARSLLDEFADGVRFVDLASLVDPSLVASTVAGTLGLKLGADTISPEAVASAIGRREVLLVLDNCEHVVNSAAGVAKAVTQHCPNVAIMATSREMLKVLGECVYRVPPLETPASEEEESGRMLKRSAVELFVSRTKAQDRDFSPFGENRQAIAAICRHLDGIPLAIEFAAARAATLGVRQVAAGLSDRFALLTSGRRTALRRHQTLRAMLDWSYALLSEPQQSLLRRLGVFAGSFSLVGVGAVAEGADASDIADLVAKSLVIFDGATTPSRWRLLETIRAYALEKLRERDEYPIAARRHAEYYRQGLEKARKEWDDLPAAEWLQRYRHLIYNVRAALEWTFSPEGDAALAVALTAAAVPLWFQMSLIDEASTRVQQALLTPLRSPDPRCEMQLQAALAWSLMQTRGSVADTRAAWSATLKLSESLDDIDYQLRAILGLWAGLLNSARLREALELAERFCSLAARSTDPSDALIGDRMVGYILHLLGEQVEARRRIERMLSQYVAPVTGPKIIRFFFDQRVIARCFLARILWLQGFPDQSMNAVETAISEAKAAKDMLTLCQVMVQAACPIAILTGDSEKLGRFVDFLLDYAARNALGFWRTWGRCFKAVHLVNIGDLDGGLRLLSTGLEELRQMQYGVYYVAFVCAYAEALGKAGKATAGLVSIEEALTRCQQNEENWYIAELLRVKGELILQRGGSAAAGEAEAQFNLSLGWARRQQVLSWELRTATSLARLRRDNAGPEQTKTLLASVYEKFTEGFATADLIAAREFLDELS
jgi:predicted ATPase